MMSHACSAAAGQGSPVGLSSGLSPEKTSGLEEKAIIHCPLEPRVELSWSGLIDSAEDACLPLWQVGEHLALLNEKGDVGISLEQQLGLVLFHNKKE